MRYVGILVTLALTACGGHYTPLPRTHAGDPIIPLNPDMWAATANDLMAAPVVAAPIGAPPPVTAVSTR
jgi:hypothetical protein